MSKNTTDFNCRDFGPYTIVHSNGLRARVSEEVYEVLIGLDEQILLNNGETLPLILNNDLDYAKREDILAYYHDDDPEYHADAFQFFKDLPEGENRDFAKNMLAEDFKPGILFAHHFFAEPFLGDLSSKERVLLDEITLLNKGNQCCSLEIYVVLLDSIYEELLTEDEKIIIDELYFHKYQAVHALRKVKKFTSEEFNNVLLSFNSRSLSMTEYDRIPTTDIGKVIYQELYQDGGYRSLRDLTLSYFEEYTPF